MEFEFDQSKSESNREKHGISFIQAQALWDDHDLIEILARTTDEPRFLIVGKIKDLHWFVIISYRGANIRIISVRRSRKEEVEFYES